MTQNQTARDLSLVEPENIGTPARTGTANGYQIAPSGLLPSRDEWPVFIAMARNLAKTPFGQNCGGEAGIVSIMFYARELGIPPMLSVMGGFHNVQGHLEMSARLINLRIRQLGHKIELKELTDQKCVIAFERTDTGEKGTIEYTIQDAETAGLVKGGGNWDKHPKDMLWARAVTRLGRRHIPEAVGMAYVEGEISELMIGREIPRAVQATVIDPEGDQGPDDDNPDGNGGAGGNGGSESGESDPSRGRNDDIRHPDESMKLAEFKRRINAEIEKAFGPIDPEDKRRTEIWNGVEAFIAECARANKSTEDDVKMQAVDAWDEFRGFLLKRLNHVFKDAAGSVPESSGEREEPGDELAPESETIKTGPEEMDPVALMRLEFINLTKKGLPTFVFKNLDRIEREFPPALIQELREKWIRVIDDGAPFPLDKRKDDGPITNGNGPGNRSIICPKKDGARVFPEICEAKCSYRETCEAYRKFKGIPIAGGSKPPEEAGFTDDDDMIWCSQYAKHRALHECAEGCPLDPNRCKAYLDKAGKKS